MYRGPLEAAAARATELAAAPVALSHQWIVDNIILEMDPEPEGFDSLEEIVRDAQRMGLRHVGRKTEGIRGRAFRMDSDVFVDDTARAFVIVRGKVKVGDIASLGSKYWIMTLFDDMVALLTCSLVEPFLTTTERVWVRAGTDNLAQDLARHLAEVDTRGDAAMVLPARDHRDVLRSLRIYFRQSISPRMIADMRDTKDPDVLSRWFYVALVKLRRLWAPAKRR